MNKTEHCQCVACKDGTIHASDCAVHNMPAYPNGPCDCGANKTIREAFNTNWKLRAFLIGCAIVGSIIGAWLGHLAYLYFPLR